MTTSKRHSLCRKMSAILIALSSLLFFPAKAQVHIGFTAGGTAAFVSQQSGTEQTGDASQFKPGFNGGIKVDIPIQKKKHDNWSISLTPELFFIQNGANNQYYTSVTELTDSIGRLKLNYFGLYAPVKFKMQKDPGSRGLYLLAGGFFDVVTDASTGDGDTENAVIFSSKSDKTDFGFRGSLGLILPGSNGNASFLLELGYYKGLNNIRFYTGASDPNSPYAITNNGVIFSITTFF